MLALCSRSIFSVGVFLRATLPSTIAIAIAFMASFGEANAGMDTSEEIPDQIVPGFIAPGQATPLDAFGYLVKDLA